MFNFFRDNPGMPVPERQNQSGFYRGKREWVAVASAGPYASLHLAPDKHKKLKPGLVAFNNIRPDNGADLFSKEKISKGGDK